MSDRPLTGRGVFLIVASAFTVIIGVNLTLAYNAVATFPGVEAKNSYTASQTFEARRAAQLALGWEVTAGIEGDVLTLSFLGPDGPVAPRIERATLGKATSVVADRTPDFTWTGEAYSAKVDVAPGNWNLRLVAVADNGVRFERRFPLLIRPGA